MAVKTASVRRLSRYKDHFRAYLLQILIDGVFHADPHPGSVLLTLVRRSKLK
jgi:predicted unusual protein kinase regulating ubiquinone biosynthesis (AarF/ABC1/UbiB family)